MTVEQLPSGVTPSTLSREAVLAFIVLGGVASVFILYLLADWIRMRRENGRFELRRRLAREAWQQELKSSQPTPPTPSEPENK